MLPHTTTEIRHFAIIPAAGHGRRMGGRKLLLPWNSATIIDQVIDAWTHSLVDRTILVIRHDDDELADRCANWPVEIVRPENDPRDMKASIEYGLNYLSNSYQPRPQDRWLVAPADLPTLTSGMIDLVISATTKAATNLPDPSPTIVLPKFGSRRGHPVSFPWSMASDVFALATHEGVNRLLDLHKVHFIELPNEQAIDDVDTPEDYRQQLRQWSSLANHARQQESDEAEGDTQPQ